MVVVCGPTSKLTGDVLAAQFLGSRVRFLASVRQARPCFDIISESFTRILRVTRTLVG